jgi:hypothetical protein
VVHEDEGAGHIHLEIDDRGAAGGHQVVWTFSCTMQAALGVNLVEDLADDVEGGGEVRAADAEVDADVLADLGRGWRGRRRGSRRSR